MGGIGILFIALLSHHILRRAFICFMSNYDCLIYVYIYLCIKLTQDTQDETKQRLLSTRAIHIGPQTLLLFIWPSSACSCVFFSFHFVSFVSLVSSLLRFARCTGGHILNITSSYCPCSTTDTRPGSTRERLIHGTSSPYSYQSFCLSPQKLPRFLFLPQKTRPIY